MSVLGEARIGWDLKSGREKVHVVATCGSKFNLQTRDIQPVSVSIQEPVAGVPGKQTEMEVSGQEVPWRGLLGRGGGRTGQGRSPVMHSELGWTF